MRCRYRFSVKGHIRILKKFPIKFDDYEFDFRTTDKETIDSVWVTFPCNNEADWPKLTTLNGPIKANIRITQPRYENVVQMVRFLEGMLSFYGMESVAVDDPMTEWLPENEMEKSAIGVYSFSSSREDLDPRKLPELKLGLLAQSLYAYHDAWHLEPLLNFFRRGFIAIRDERFIEAIYNFYFYLESAYGNGHTRNYKIKREFEQCAELVSAIENARDKFDVSKHHHKKLIYHRFDMSYRGKNAREIIGTIVELRGFLHHHNRQRADIWHPEDKWTYSADAFFLWDVVHSLAFCEVNKYVFSDKVKAMFIEALKQRQTENREV